LVDADDCAVMVSVSRTEHDGVHQAESRAKLAYTMHDEPISAWHRARVEQPESRLDPRFIIVDLSFAARLTTQHERVFEIETVNTTRGNDQFTRDIPDLRADQFVDLDQSGLITVGAEVRPGSILVGKVTPRSGNTSPEELLLGELLGEERSSVRDTSLRCPPGCFGTVREVELEPRPGGRDGGARVLARARVVIDWRQPLEVGDELVTADGRRVVVVRIAELACDVAWSGSEGEIELAKLSPARDVIHARATGPHSAVSKRPLVGREQAGGQVLSEQQAAALIGVAPWTVWEMLTIKADSVAARYRAYGALVGRSNPNPSLEAEAAGPIEPSAEPESIWDRMKGEFHGIPGRPVREGDVACSLPASAEIVAALVRVLGIELRFEAERVGLRRLTAEQIREHSHGLVNKAETLDYSTLEPVPGGLFCQAVFGPVRDCTCACGKHQGIGKRGRVCETCGVELQHSSVRRERFGHVELAVPLVDPLFGDEITTVAVLPPDLRPLVPFDDERFACSDLNDHYRRLIESNERLRRLLATRAPEVILDSERNHLQKTLDALVRNEALVRSRLDPERTLRSVLGSLGDCLEALISKPVDFSGVARLVVDPELSAPRCKLPRELVFELFKPMAYGLLEEKGQARTVKQAKRALERRRAFAVAAVERVCEDYPVVLMSGSTIVARILELWDQPAIAVDDETAALLDGLDVVVHVPLSEEARAECRKLAELRTVVGCGEPADGPPPRERRGQGWFGSLLAGADIGDTLRRATLDGELDPIDDPLLRAVLGRRPV
jgi:hypothetical protein